MNTTLLLKGSDFSRAKVDALNIQKLTVTKLANGMRKVVGGALDTWADEANWKPSQNCAYSDEIVLPAGTKYIFGKINYDNLTATINTEMSDPNTYTLHAAHTVWCFYNSGTSQWNGVNTLPCSGLVKKSTKIGQKDGLFASNNSSVILTDGTIWGTELPAALNITKIVVNWYRDDGLAAPEVGLVLPEIYAGF